MTKMINKIWWLFRFACHWAFGWHWFTNEDIGVRDPMAYCEFCGKTKRLRDKCDVGKHRWKLYATSGLVTTRCHYVCTACGAKGSSLDMSGI